MAQTVQAVDLSLPHFAFPEADWGDAYQMRTTRRFKDATEAARAMFEQMPDWSNRLMALRDQIVGPLGLRTSQSIQDEPDTARIGLFEVLQRSQNLVILGENDRHMDFRLAVRLDPDDTDQAVHVTTLVRRNNIAGIAYLAAILPFHKMIVRATLGRLR